ncbi:MAG: phage holin family protein [Oculatellaceae cyanobacterium Prado106]|jgi:putative membrane protein|nr:phage holin family protein [Oculatellaceae cyanobacterium Prado106]
MGSILVTWLVTTISFLIISRIPIGVEFDNFGKAFLAAGVFGVLNALLRPILLFFGFPLIVITLGLGLFILNAIIFAIAAAIVSGFRLRYGFWSALLGSIALSIVNSVLLSLI